MTSEKDKIRGIFKQMGDQPTSLPFGSGIPDRRRFDRGSSMTETPRTYVSRDLLGQFEEKFNERLRRLENDLNVIKDEQKKQLEFMEQTKESLNELRLSVKANQLRLEHVAKDVELEKFRGEMEKTRRELEGRVSKELKVAQEDISIKFKERSKITIAWLGAISGLIAIIVSGLIQILG